MKNEALSRMFASWASIKVTVSKHLVRHTRTWTVAIIITALDSFVDSAAWSQVPTPESQFHQAIAAQQSGDYGKALEAYKSLVQRFPANIAVRINMAGLLVDLGRLDEALLNYRAGLKVDPTNRDLRFGLDAALIEKSDSEDLKIAAADLERFTADNPNELIATKLLAEVYDRQQRYPAVVALLGPLESQAKDDEDLEFLLGGAMVQVGQLSQGVSRLDRIAGRTGRADVYLAAGHARLSMSQFDQAKKDAEAAVAKQPDLPGAETLLGSVLERMGDYEGAGTALQKALSEDSEDFDANYDLGSLRYFNRDLPGATTLLEQAVRLRPSSSEARYKLALVQQSRGETQAALGNLEKVTRERPDWVEPHAKLSALYFQVHRPAAGAREAKSVEALVSRGMQVRSSSQ